MVKSRSHPGETTSEGRGGKGWSTHNKCAKPDRN